MTTCCRYLSDYFIQQRTKAGTFQEKLYDQALVVSDGARLISLRLSEISWPNSGRKNKTRIYRDIKVGNILIFSNGDRANITKFETLPIELTMANNYSSKAAVALKVSFESKEPIIIDSTKMPMSALLQN